MQACHVIIETGKHVILQGIEHMTGLLPMCIVLKAMIFVYMRSTKTDF